MKTTFPLLAVVAVLLGFSPTETRGQTSPTITQQPVSQTVAAGSSVTLSVEVSGTGPFTYQWQLDGTNLPNDIITTVAGNNLLRHPYGVAVDSSGDVFIADEANDAILEITANGTVLNVAGDGSYGFSGDGGPAANATMAYPSDVAVDLTGNFFIADTYNNRVRRVSTNGIITTIAGNGGMSLSGDGGPATNASLYLPFGVAVDASGNVFIADSYNNVIRLVSTNGIITTAAGNGRWGYSGDGGPATSARISLPWCVAVDTFGNLFISDTGNACVRKVGVNGIITTVAGDGTAGFAGDGGPATAASLEEPFGVVMDRFGNLFIGDSGNNRVRKVGSAGIITTFAGNGASESSGDGGPATNAGVFNPRGIAVDAAGDVFVAEAYGSKIREVLVQGPTLALSSVAAANAGAYDIVVANAYGAVTSSVAVLTLSGSPQITVQPRSLDVTNGQSASLAVTANGTGLLSYQWFFDNTALFGNSSATLIFPSVSAADIGSYNVVVSNAYGSITSSVATVSVSQPFWIIVQPQDLSVTNGVSASFSVTATNGAPLSYQWFFDGEMMTNSTNVSGVQTSSLLINNAETSDQGTYTVLVTNACGQILSSPAILTVASSGPLIVVQPAGQTVFTGSNTYFSVGVEGTSPFSYQWLFDGTALANGPRISGAQSSTLTINNIQSSDQGSYQVIITDVDGTASSVNAVLSVARIMLPAIVNEPVSQTLYPGAAASFSVGASGTAPLSYQWLFDGVALADSPDISGAQSNVLSVYNTQFSNSGSYQVMVTNAWGSALSAPAALSVIATNTGPPSIISQTYNQGINAGNNATFSVTAFGAPPLSYQWLFDGTTLTNSGHISGAQSNVLSIFNVQPSDQGGYQLVVTNTLGSAVSFLADLNVMTTNGQPAFITNQPISLELVLGSSGSFYTGAISFTPASYQWYFDGTALAGATTPTLSINNAQAGNAGSYQCVISNSAGSVTSLVATLTLGLPPQITAQPTSQAAVAGANLALNVGVTGTPPLTYQWQFNGPNAVNDLITTVAGNGTFDFTGDGGTATNSSLASPRAVAVDSAGNLFIADTYNYRIRKVTPAGMITTVAGNGLYLYAGDGMAATNAALNGPLGVAVDGAGDIFISDSGNNRIRKVSSGGTISTVAGNGIPVYSGDGVAATGTGLQDPGGIALDSSGNLYIADQGNLRIRKVAPNGIISTIAGNGVDAEFGDGGQATNASIHLAYDVAVDNAGNVYIAQSYGRVRKIDPSGIITTIAQTTTSGEPFDINPVGVCADNSGNLFIADSDNHLLELGITGTLSTVAGNGSASFSGDGGPAANATLNAPSSVAADPTGNLFVADSGNNRVREILGQGLDSQGATLLLNNVAARNAGSYDVIIVNAFGSITSSVATLSVGSPPQIDTPPGNQSVLAGSNVTLTVAASGTSPLSYQWLFDGASLSGSSDATLSLPAVNPSASGSYAVVVSNAYGSVTSAVATLLVAESVGALVAAPSIVVQPQSLVVINSNSATFAVTAAGTAPLAYQWLFNGAAMPGETSSVLGLASAASGDAGSYSVIVSNAYGTAPSDAAVLTVQVPAVILQQPVSQVVPSGATITLAVAAKGSGPLDYQWKRNGSPISGAKVPALTLPNVGLTEVGNYVVTITNALAAVESDAASITLAGGTGGSPPAITSQPQSLTAGSGQPVALTVSATGTAPLSYQWLCDGTLLPGATCSGLAFSSVTASNAGTYAVLVGNPFGLAASSVVTLQVAPWLRVQGFSASAGALTIAGSGFTPGNTYRLLTSTDPSLPLTNWTLVATGHVDNNGNLSVTAAYSVGDQKRFFAVASP